MLKSLPMARILCVEDSREFQIYLSSILREHSLTHVGTIDEAIRAVDSGNSSFDLVLLDVSLPDGNGMKALPRLKSAFTNRPIPFIVISADGDTLTKVAAFGVGADDYISKPPDSSELRARIEAKLRWVNSIPDQKTTLSFENVHLDSERIAVEFVQEDGMRRPLELTPFEFKILKLLMGRPGQVFSRDLIIERLWGVGKHVTPRTVDAHVSHLRAKLAGTRIQIETVLTEGYKISKVGDLPDEGKS